jgi:MFS superfamily sulfate permease-like transporter
MLSKEWKRIKPATNNTYKKLAVQWLNEALCFVSSLVVADSLELRKHQLPLVAKRSQGFLLAVVLAGIIQLIAGFLRFGIIANYFPSAVIKGMLASIGIILILKQMPHLIGFDADFIGDEAFIQKDGLNTLTELFYAIQNSNVGSFIIGFISLLLLIIFDLSVVKKNRFFAIIPGLLLVFLQLLLINYFCLFLLPLLSKTLT